MSVFSTSLIYGATIRESANNGSDFTNPAADYRRLFLGEDGGLHVLDSAGALTMVGPGQGSAFPASANTNDRFYHTTHATEFFYDGTRWRSTGQNQLVIPNTDSVLPFSATGGQQRVATPVWSGSDIWLIQAWTAFFVSGGTALSASHKWVGILNKQPANTTIATFTIDSGASSAWRMTAAASIGALLTTTNFELDVFWTKTGTPGNLFASTTLSFQYVAT